ncbi:MAG: tRNA 2-thiocytidine(32) synthetase TtcA [Clostridiales bacterium]|nr:tRNA 2-thiocytidine(32) synthetase TtcA [Clostridiales bacterium]
MQKILGKMRKAIQDYNMIQENDKIAIGLSGGKDSMALLYCLARLQKFSDIKFDIVAITIHPGMTEFDTSYLEKTCEELGVKYVIYKSDIKEIVFDIRNEKNPCSLCANLRRGMLTSVAIENGCNKIALGHHYDDVIETFFLSLLYEGHIHTFSPVTYLSRNNIYTIRPFIYVEEKNIIKWVKKDNIQIMNKCCKIDGHTKREYMKDLVKKLVLDIPHVRANIFGAIKRSNIRGWNIEGGTNEKKD